MGALGFVRGLGVGRHWLRRNAGSFRSGQRWHWQPRRRQARPLLFGIEIDPAYVDITVLRWQAFTRANATLQGRDRSFADAIGRQKAPPDGPARPPA
jgi:hypothetical protein